MYVPQSERRSKNSRLTRSAGTTCSASHLSSSSNAGDGFGAEPQEASHTRARAPHLTRDVCDGLRRHPLVALRQHLETLLHGGVVEQLHCTATPSLASAQLTLLAIQASHPFRHQAPVGRSRTLTLFKAVVAP
jgi:hypothetical protein